MPESSIFRQTLAHVYQRFNALQRGEKRCFGVSMSQCVTLETLHQRGPCGVRELAQALGIEQSTVSRVVDVLVRDGLVRRARDEAGDRRRVFVSLTARGRNLARRLERCADAYTERILARIPVDRRPEVLGALELLVAALDELPEDRG
jgi:DNA-binding MarR family transcriptional regulator